MYININTFFHSLSFHLRVQESLSSFSRPFGGALCPPRCPSPPKLSAPPLEPRRRHLRHLRVASEGERFPAANGASGKPRGVAAGEREREATSALSRDA